MPRIPTALALPVLALGCAASGGGWTEAPIPPPVQSFTALSLTAGPGTGQVAAPGTKDDQALELYSATSASGTVELLYPASQLVVRAKGESCDGPPQLVVLVDRSVVLSTEVPQADWADFPATVSLSRGPHDFQVVFPNDHWNPGHCDRNLVVDRLTLLTDRRPGSDAIDGESLNVNWGASLIPDEAAHSGQALELSSSTSATGVVVLSRAMGGLAIRARGDQCQGPPDLQLDVDGKRVLSTPVPENVWTDRWIALPLAAGEHTVAVRFPNDLWQPPACDRNLYVDRLWFAPAVPAGQGSPAPAAGR